MTKNKKKALIYYIFSLVFVLSGYAIAWYYYGFNLFAALALIGWAHNLVIKAKEFHELDSAEELDALITKLKINE